MFTFMGLLNFWHMPGDFVHVSKKEFVHVIKWTVSLKAQEDAEKKKILMTA